MKTFVIDTNVLMSDPFSLEAFGENEVVIPITVLDELDDAKIRPDQIGRNSRFIIKKLDELREQGSLKEGVKFNKSIIKIELNNCKHIPEGLFSDKKDNRIISVAIGLSKTKNVILITKDINLRVKCDTLGIKAQDYIKDKVTKDVQSIYNGSEIIEVSQKDLDLIYSNGYLEKNINGFPNQFFILKNGKQSAISYFEKNKLKLCNPMKQIFGISPRNAEQLMAFNLLLNTKIKLVTLIGRSGSGKTLLSVASALYQVLSKKIYSRILLSRPIQPLGKDLGFLPGTIQEKMKPWMQPIYDNLEYLLSADQFMINEYMDTGIIQIEPLTYIRGRSIPKSLLIIDEAQNMKLSEIKTVITRIGEESKIILTGDIEQIDAPYLDFANNGLTHAVEKFKEFDISGHITLRKGERSELATLASDIL